MRLIRLVVAASSSVLSVDDETKMNRKKHESSLLEALSVAGSTPAASTNFLMTIQIFFSAGGWRFCGRFGENGRFWDGFWWCFCGEFVVFLWFLETRFPA